MDKISESILKSIDIIIDRKIQNLQFDKTLVCQIVKVIDEKTYSYQVSYMDSLFIAYDLLKLNTYKVGDCVYVKIPQNDFGAKKIIEGLYS